MQRFALFACLVFAACGGSGPPPDETFDLSGRDLSKKDGGGEEDADVPVPVDLAGDAATQSPQAPEITVTLPADLNADVTGSLLNLAVTVTSPVGNKISSVLVTIAGAPPVMLTANGPGGHYTGSIDISGVAAFADMTITAVDSANVPGTLTKQLRHDRGPEITFLQPTATTARGSVNVRVKINDGLYNPVVAADVTAKIRMNGDVVLSLVAGTDPPEFDGTITFNSFAPVLSGDNVITVTAKNSKGTTTTASKQFTVDNTGPVITIVSPVGGNFVGGLTNITATIKDAEKSGINNATVKAVFAGGTNFQVALTPSPTEMDTYVGVFDIHQLGTEFSFPVLTVSADDTLNNHTDASITLKIDNTPPILSLDPPDMRVEIRNGSGLIQCSVLFDPVGDESINDGFNPLSPVQVLSVKARVEDRANHATGQLVDYISGINNSTVRLVAIPAGGPGAPILAVDIDGDGVCDDLNPNLVQVMSGTAMTQAQYIQINMAPVTLVGQPNYYDPVEPVTGNCDIMGDPTVVAPPMPLCASAGTQLTYALQYTDPPTPAIWTLPPVENTNSGCIGLQFDTLNRLPEGPACLAVAATDNTGNRSISAPLRMCVRRSSGGPCDTFTPPDCTGSYDPVTQVTTATPCTPRKFQASGEIRFLIN